MKLIINFAQNILITIFFSSQYGRMKDLVLVLEKSYTNIEILCFQHLLQTLTLKWQQLR